MTMPEGEAQRRAREAKRLANQKSAGRGDQPATQETVDSLFEGETPQQQRDREAQEQQQRQSDSNENR